MGKRKPAKSKVDVLAAKVAELRVDLKDLDNRLAALGEKVEARQRGECLDKNGLARFLGLAPRTIERMKDRGQIPFHKIGGSVRWTPEDVDEMLRNTAELVETEDEV